MKPIYFVLCLCIGCVCGRQSIAQNWPQAAGPRGDWSTRAEGEVPTPFSVASGKNVLWTKPLEESGQSGIAVWGDRVFLTVLKPFEPGEGRQKKTSGIRALALDAATGETLWEYDIQSGGESVYMYGFSDLSSPSPVTDGKFVWFTNAGGKLVCLDWQGGLVWERSWRSENEVLKPKHAFPFNKQFEPYLVGDTLVHAEPYDRRDGRKEAGWHYVVGLDKKTGAEKWISEDALTHYNTPGFSNHALGKPTLLIGRGGYHNVPESPPGYSMIDLANGERVWRTVLDGKGDTALSNACFNDRFAVWISEHESRLTVLDAQDGEVLRTIDLRANVDLRVYDPLLERYVLREDFDLTSLPKSRIHPAWYTNYLDGDHLYFMCFNDDLKQPLMKRWGDLLPLHCFARANLVTGKVEILEVPVHLDDRGEHLWKEELKTTGLNARGIDVISDQRSKRDGWWWCFNGNPIKVNDTLLFTTMIGNCYAFRAGAERFDEDALISLNPLGPRGESWSLNTPTFANGKLYHRTATELICVGRE
ncbi:Outer membrane protein assembly factor BamB [Pirellulimonas nuda]|uniref:Outer membrane protein assembly factor BamB n=1 Tax=Pirellulimonas nuda TaxID=2528009 RepID=A0A518D5D9_9BACT|nr:PQQ-binding-like beta-propeller repeat protein [Pirellulimonas nuda]QDU86690.1 Outer membrane protein assembly factor BamB [Pirellulimonas nuda]